MTNQNQDHDHDHRRLERSLRVWMTEGRPPLVDREAQIDSVLESLDDTPQTRARFLGRWFDRGRGARRGTDAHDHPPNTNRRSRLMLSATGSIAAFAVLALTANGLLPGLSQPAAHTTVTFTVAQDGSGQFTTISEAIAAASDGNTVLVRPGTYTEVIEIHDDITLTGDGPVEDIVIVAPADAPRHGYLNRQAVYVDDSYGVLLRDSDATLTGLTFSGDETTVVVDGGAPTLTGLRFETAGVPYDGIGYLDDGHALLIDDASAAIVRANVFDRSGPVGAVGHSRPLIADNILFGGSHIWGRFGEGAVLRHNSITEPTYFAIDLAEANDVLVEGNTITGASTAVSGGGLTWGSTPSIVRNVIRDSRRGIQIGDGSTPIIDGNEFIGVDTAMLLSGTNAKVEGNSISNGLLGIVVTLNLSDGFDRPIIRDNTIEVSGRAIDIGAGTSPTVASNTICGGDGVVVHRTATPKLEDNPLC